MKRIIIPIKKFGTRFKKNKTKLPISFKGPKILKPINYTEKLGSAQCKSALMIAALKSKGVDIRRGAPANGVCYRRALVPGYIFEIFNVE